MKYKKLKAELDKHFNDDDEIYPHEGSGCVVFYKIYHGQPGGLIEEEPGGALDCVVFYMKKHYARL
jgi:hypothetical protein